MPIITEPATGLHTPIGATRAGIWIREADAVVWAADLRKALRYMDAPQTCEQKVLELIDLLEHVKR